MTPRKDRSASLADVGCLLTSWSAVSSDSEMPASSSGTGVRAAVTTTCCAGAATLNLTTKLCSSAAIAFIAGANPGASTCTPSSWAEIPLKLASPEPAVFWLAITRLPLRILTCAPATGRESGSTTETLISAPQAQKAVKTKTLRILGTREKEKLGNTAHPPLHAKGLMERIAPVSWLARAIAASLPVAWATVAGRKIAEAFSSRLAYSCAAARVFHPLPCLHQHDEDAQIREVVKNRPVRLEPRMYKRERTMSIAQGFLPLLADAV